MIRAAIHSSPSSSPIKDEAEREASLKIFRDVQMAKRFDYNIQDVPAEHQQGEDDGSMVALEAENEDDDGDDGIVRSFSPSP